MIDSTTVDLVFNGVERLQTLELEARTLGEYRAKARDAAERELATIKQRQNLGPLEDRCRRILYNAALSSMPPENFPDSMFMDAVGMTVGGVEDPPPELRAGVATAATPPPDPEPVAAAAPPVAAAAPPAEAK